MVFENLCSESNKSIFITYFKLDEMKTLTLWKSGFTKRKRYENSLVYRGSADSLKTYFVWIFDFDNKQNHSEMISPNFAVK